MNQKKCKKIRQLVRAIDAESNNNLPWAAYSQANNREPPKKDKSDDDGSLYSEKLPGTITLTEQCNKYWVKKFKKLEAATHGTMVGPLKLLPEVVKSAKVLRPALAL